MSKHAEQFKAIKAYTKPKWYRNENFPVIPILRTKKADQYNTKSFSFCWLFIKVWSRDSFDFELAVVLNPTHWGIGVTALLPYLRIVVAIPFPGSWQIWCQRNLWRKPKPTEQDLMKLFFEQGIYLGERKNEAPGEPGAVI